jgi:nucleotide-binding universal stress UspA family protein
MFKRLLVPLDGSRFGSRALQVAIMVAKQFSAEIILIQVVKRAIPVTATAVMPPGTASPEATEIAIRAALEEQERTTVRARRYLSGKVRGINHHNIKSSYQVLVGKPAESIMEFANEKNMDLVVMTTHGKSGIKRAIMGSVADTVIRESGKPVLVINPRSGGKKRTR